MRRLLVILSLVALTACNSAAEKKTLGIQFEDFANNLNAKNSEFVIAQELDFKTTDGSDALKLQYMFNDTTALKASINKSDHKIQEILIVKAIGGDSSLDKAKSIIDAPTLASLSMQALNPGMEKSTIGPVVLEMFEKAAKHNNIDYSHTLNSNKYSVKFDSEYQSYMFSVTPL